MDARVAKWNTSEIILLNTNEIILWIFASFHTRLFKNATWKRQTNALQTD